MKYKVTGGQDGISGIDVAGKRYEAGDDVELTTKQADWLVDQGYVVAADGSKKATATAIIEETIIEETL